MNLIATFLMLLPSAPALALQEVQTVRRPDSLLAGSTRSPTDAPAGKIYKKHDHIQIIVRERASARVQADFDNDKRSRTEIELGAWPRLVTRSGGFPPRLEAARLTGDPEIDLDARYRQQHSGRTTRDFDLTFTVMAEVVDIRPNGNIVIEAKKTRRVNEEEEVIRITGEVAPAFIVADTIQSEKIMNLRVEYNGTGSVSDSADQGFLGWLVSKVWPF